MLNIVGYLKEFILEICIKGCEYLATTILN